MFNSVEATFAALTPLLGVLEGKGRAQFPTVPPHEYVETLRVTGEADRLHLHFEQIARHRPVGAEAWLPSHWESGFFRVTAPGIVELTNAQDNGRLEVVRLELEATATGISLKGATTLFVNDPRMIQATRHITVEGDRLWYKLEMATTAVHTLSAHLEADLARVREAR